MRSHRRALVVAMALFAVGNIVATFARSGIPYSFDGRVEAIEVNSEKVPGIDDVWLVVIDGGDSIHLDNRFAAQLEEGEQVRKRFFGRTLARSAGEDISLSPSRDFWGMFPALLLFGTAVWYLDRRRKGAPEGAPKNCEERSRSVT